MIIVDHRVDNDILVYVLDRFWKFLFYLSLLKNFHL